MEKEKGFVARHWKSFALTVIVVILILFFGWRFQWEISIPGIGKITPPTPTENNTISSFILYHAGVNPKIEILNRGTEDLYLYGDQFNNEASITDQKRIIPTGYSYFLNADLLAQWIEVNIGMNGERHVPFNIFLTDTREEKYVMKNTLYIKVLNSAVTIQPQTLSLLKENW